MRKSSILLILCFLFLPLFAHAKDNPPRKEVRIPDRIFEMGLNVGVDFSNNFLSINDVFKETMILDIDKFKDGLKMNFGFNLTPLHFSVNSKKGWGFGLSTSIDATGILGLSGEMLSFQKADDSKSELSGAVFASAGLDIYFPVQKFKVKFRPSAFYTVAYIKPDISYTYNILDEGAQLFIDYNVKVFTAFPMEDFPNNFQLTAMPGFDFSLGFEYPLSKETGMSDKIPFLDFDFGLDFINIPVVPSTMKNYMKMSGSTGSKTPVEMEGLISSFEDIEMEPVYGEGSEKISRPFRVIARADWRPFLGSRLFTITPSFGFSLNDIYMKPFSYEAGLKARLDLINLLIVTAGISYEDRLWVNSYNLALNFRAVELNIGANLRSQDFFKIWDGYGIGAYFGLKFGW
jgi:hypothetical protein